MGRAPVLKICGFAILALGPPVLLVLMYNLRLFPGSAELGRVGDLTAFLAVLLFFVLLASGLVGFVLLTLVFAAGTVRSRRALFITGLVMLIWSMAAIPANLVGYSLRLRAMERGAQNAQPLVDAIEQFHRDRGRYPETLNQLMPKHLLEVPSTGMCGYREFRYARCDEVFRTPTGGYELKVDTSLGPLNWDVFIYWPNGQYPAYTYGGRVERIGDWAYVHE